jgi:folate-binding protein YgfZ
MISPREQLPFVTETAGVFLTDDRVLHVRGEDAQSWLNGQITNDVRELSADVATYALAATLKGRVISDLWAIKESDAAAVVLPASGFDAAFETFDKHVIMEDVELEPDPSLRVVAIVGPRASEVAEAVPGLGRYRADRLHSGGVDLWVPAAQLEQTLAQLGEKARSLGGGVLDEAGFTHARVALGVPRFGVDFGGDHYPQEAGLKARALSFSKGCYRGQEVIYMLENRGQLARRLVVLECAQPLERGTQLEAEGKRVGEITTADVTPTASGATLLLGYVKRPQAEVGRTLLAAGQPCTVRSVVGVADESCPIVAP